MNGLGFGRVSSPSIQGATSGVIDDDAGVASATVNTSQQIGGSIAAALPALLLRGEPLAAPCFGVASREVTPWGVVGGGDVTSRQAAPSVGVRIEVRRSMTALLAVSAAVVGSWAEFAPRFFYDSFPLPGHPWVSELGPYNEHLTRDVGGLYLSLLVASAWAAVRPRPDRFTVVGAAWLAFSVPHLLFHLQRLSMYDVTDRAGSVIALGGTVLVSALLLLPARKPRRPSRAEEQGPTWPTVDVDGGVR